MKLTKTQREQIRALVAAKSDKEKILAEIKRTPFQNRGRLFSRLRRVEADIKMYEEMDILGNNKS